MTHEQIATLSMFLVSLVFFVTQKLPVGVTALLIPVALGLCGVLTPRQALEGFGNPAVITVAGMFVLSRALVSSGAPLNLLLFALAVVFRPIFYPF